MEAQPKRIERSNDIIVLLATMTWCASNQDKLQQIGRQHPDSEIVLLFPTKQECQQMFDNSDVKSQQQISDAFDTLERNFIKRTHAWSSDKHMLAPQFAADLIDKTKTSRGYVVDAQDDAYKHPAMQKIANIVKSKCSIYNVELIE